ncbi:MAG: hypothetical protein RR911_06330 [Oscillospiraceae bacterium]
MKFKSKIISKVFALLITISLVFTLSISASAFQFNRSYSSSDFSSSWTTKEAWIVDGGTTVTKYCYGYDTNLINEDVANITSPVSWQATVITNGSGRHKKYAARNFALENWTRHSGSTVTYRFLVGNENEIKAY